jgi:hypothetical protein
MHWLRFALLLAALAPIGCRGAKKPAEPEGTPPDTSTHLGSECDIHLGDWLGQPRHKIAEMTGATSDSAQAARQEARNNPKVNKLLPKLQPPLLVPVLHKATYSAASGVSLPDYLKEGQKDADLAIHLARHGDVDAALKIAPDDEGLRRHLESFRGQRNYPVEWTRLVALKVHHAELRLAQGDIDAATELVAIHRQLHDVLDSRNANGPLGAALLPLGRKALSEAAAAWRQPTVNKVALADDIDKALADWGDVPAVSLPQASGRSDVARLFNVSAARERSVAAHQPDSAARMVDLLALPVVPEGVEAVVGFFGADDRLSDVVFVYRGKINEVCPEPVQLAHGLVNRNYGGKDLVWSRNLPATAFDGDGLTWEVTLVPRSPTLGGLVRVHNNQAAQPPAVPRSVGPVQLDATFETNRVAVDPNYNSDLRIVTVKSPEGMSRFRPPLAVAPVTAALLRDGDHNVLGSLTLSWSTKRNATALHELLLPLWAAYGPARVDALEGGDNLDAHLALVWEDQRTRLSLRLPYTAANQPQFVAADRRDTPVKVRAEEAVAFDREARKKRWEAGAPEKHLSRRAPDVDVELGMSKQKALAALPREGVRRRDLADGVTVFLEDQVPVARTFGPRQIFVRFQNDRVVELRVRYQEHPKQPNQERKLLVDVLRRDNGGFEEIVPAPWTRLWSDLPAASEWAESMRWRDDLTLTTLQHDEGGHELALRDCPADRPDGVALPPLDFVSSGVDGCHLGDKRKDVLAYFKVEKPQVLTDEGVLLLPKRGQFDAVVVYFAGVEGRVVRVLARHTGKPPADVNATLLATWDHDWGNLGVIRRIESNGSGWGWHDDRTRVRIFVNQDRGESRLWTEWRTWPVGGR